MPEVKKTGVKECRSINEINWPAVIKHANSVLLTYLEGLSSWDELVQDQYWSLNEEDVLIDVPGRKWKITGVLQKQLALNPAGNVELHEFERLVREHMVITGSCCVAKVRIRSYEEAMHLIASAVEY